MVPSEYIFQLPPLKERSLPLLHLYTVSIDQWIRFVPYIYLIIFSTLHYLKTTETASCATQGILTLNFWKVIHRWSNVEFSFQNLARVEFTFLVYYATVQYVLPAKRFKERFREHFSDSSPQWTNVIFMVGLDATNGFPIFFFAGFCFISFNLIL